MDEALFDLSLFAVSPTNDHHFSVPEIPSFESLGQDRSQLGRNNGAQRQGTGSRTMKPLPSLPRHRCAAFGPDSRRCDGASRCILSRLMRSRSDDQNGGTAYRTGTIQQRRSTQPIPQLTLSVPQTAHPGRSPNAMVWMEHEQMWLVREVDGINASYQNPDAYEPPPSYYAPSYAHSEPSPRPSSPEVSPVRDQLMSLIQRRVRDSDDMLSLSFQEAIHGVSMQEYSHTNEPVSFRIERDWQYENSIVDSLADDLNDVGDLLPPHHHCACCERARWQRLGQGINRPHSAL